MIPVPVKIIYFRSGVEINLNLSCSLGKAPFLNVHDRVKLLGTHAHTAFVMYLHKERQIFENIPLKPRSINRFSVRMKMFDKIVEPEIIFGAEILLQY